ncbi:hypothetical protein Mapa_005825 [Marchantia paleacea]|nr:hypothetical protein Mapa_005825 [Marchantia paleacea]
MAYYYGGRNYQGPPYDYTNWNQCYPVGYGSRWLVDNRALHEAESQSAYCSRQESEYSQPCYQPPCQGPVCLKLTICCEGGKRKLEKALLEMNGVYEVRIDGWTNAMVTVMGTAPPNKVLRKASKHMKSAEFWSNSHVYSASDNNHNHHSSH